MTLLTRRKMLTNVAPLAGTFALPTLAAAVQDVSTPYQRPKLKIADVRTAQFRRFLVGQDPLNVDALWERIRVSGLFAGAQGGQYVTALTGLEIALWDLAGKALGLPVYQLLGGKFRDKIRIYCDSDMDDPLGPESDKKLPWIKDQGFTAMKIDLDYAADPHRFDRVNWTANNAEVDRMVSWVKHLRESIPKEMELACDMHGRYDAATAKRVAKELEPFRLLWLEEVVPPENIDAIV